MIIVSIMLASAAAGYALFVFYRDRRGGHAAACDLRRCLVLIGEQQNDERCIAQRRALKPLLIRVQHVGMNVVEVYGSMIPRRNGRALEWLDNRALRRKLKATSGFHLVCLDDDSETVLHSQRPVSHAMLSEFVAMSEPLALPAPDTDFGEEAPLVEPRRSPSEPETSWGRVGGVLR